MYIVSDSFKSAINKPSRELKSRITLPDNTVLDDTNITSIVYNSAIVASNDFELGTAIMATADIELIDRDYSINYDFEDKEILIEIAIKLESGLFEYVPLGLFTIEKAVRNDRKISLASSDRMHMLEVAYSGFVSYPATLYEIADDICKVAGVVLANESFPNSDYIVNKQPDLSKVSCRKAIAAIAELAGGYARITRDGKLEIFNINVTSKTSMNYASSDGFAMADFVPINDELIAGVIEVNRNNYINLSNKDSIKASIDKVIVRVGAEEAVKGDGENPYYILDNIFCQNPNSVIEGLYEVLNGFAYMPFTSKWQGNPAIDPGDMISINPGQGFFNTIVTSKKLTYKGGLREEYKAVGKSNTEKKSTSKGSLTLDMEKAVTEIKVLDGRIEQRVTSEEFESYTVQTEQELQDRVSRGDDLKTEVTQNAESWKLSIDGKLKGTTYEFTGDSFKIGDTEGGDTAEHTPACSKYMHSDGSYTKISADGLERVATNKSNPYHYLSYVGQVNFPTIYNSSLTVTITLPEEFKNKNFRVIASVREFYSVSTSVPVTAIGCWVTDIDYVNGTVELLGDALLQNSNTTGVGLSVNYTVIA